MNNSFYIGFRVETYKKLLKEFDKKKNAQYNRSHRDFQIKSFITSGKVIVKKKDEIIFTNGVEIEELKTSSLSNFLLLSKQRYDENEAYRIMKIINVLGNDKAIKENISDFLNGNSILSIVPELEGYKKAFIDFDLQYPGFSKKSWFYAPEFIVV